MHKHILIKLIALALACSFHNAQAAILSIKLSDHNKSNDSLNYTTNVNSTFDAKIYIDEVADFAGFDFSLSYDKTKLQALTLTSGNIFKENTAPIINSITPGKVSLVESSLGAGLNIAKNELSLLGTIQFQALSTAKNYLLNIYPILSDSNGDPINGGTIQTAWVSINPAVAAPAAPVPLPASAFMFVPGFLALFGARKTNAGKHAI